MFCFQNCLKTCCVLWLSLVINIVSYISSEAAILLVVVFDSFITQCRWKSTTRNTTCHPFWSSVRSSNWKHSLQRTLLFLFLQLHNVWWRWPCLYHQSKQCYFQGGGFFLILESDTAVKKIRTFCRSMMAIFVIFLLLVALKSLLLLLSFSLPNAFICRICTTHFYYSFVLTQRRGPFFAVQNARFFCRWRRDALTIVVGHSIYEHEGTSSKLKMEQQTFGGIVFNDQFCSYTRCFIKTNRLGAWHLMMLFCCCSDSIGNKFLLHGNFLVLSLFSGSKILFLNSGWHSNDT